MTDTQMALSVDELHPFVHAYEGGTVVHAPAETIARWRQVMADFEDVQAEMLAAHTAARLRDEEESRLRAAELDAERAQARLDALRYELTNPPERIESWPMGDPAPVECRGRQYPTKTAAWEGRIRAYDDVARRGAEMPCDIAPYVCTEGHWHLGAVS